MWGRLVWLSDDRRLAVFFFLVFLLVVFIILVAIVWVSRRHRTGEVLQPIETVFGKAMDHVGTVTPTDPRWFRGTSRPAHCYYR